MKSFREWVKKNKNVNLNENSNEAEIQQLVGLIDEPMKQILSIQKQFTFNPHVANTPEQNSQIHQIANQISPTIKKLGSSVLSVHEKTGYEMMKLGDSLFKSDSNTTRAILEFAQKWEQIKQLALSASSSAKKLFKSKFGKFGG
jgi:cell division protein ZapA (FtsZ GTPase activity inhibitor)